jgi:hypothetical protein
MVTPGASGSQHARAAGRPAGAGRRVTRAALSSILLAALLALATCSGSTAGAGGGTTQSDFAPTASASGTASGTPSSPHIGSGGAATPGAPAATAFQVSGVSAWVDDGGASGQCASTKPFTFLGIITFPAGNPGGALKYFWGRTTEGGGDQPVQTVTIQPGQTELQVSDTWNVSAQWGDGRLLMDTLFTQSPNGMISNHVRILLVCPFSFSEVRGSLPTKFSQWCPSAYDRFTNARLSVPFSYTIYVNPSPGGTVQYTVTYSAPSGPPQPAPTTGSKLVGGGVPSVDVSNPWNITAGSPTGQYTETLTVTSPTNLYGSGGPASVTFTKTC